MYMSIYVLGVGRIHKYNVYMGRTIQKSRIKATRSLRYSHVIIVQKHAIDSNTWK